MQSSVKRPLLVTFRAAVLRWAGSLISHKLPRFSPLTWLMLMEEWLLNVLGWEKQPHTGICKVTLSVFQNCEVAILFFWQEKCAYVIKSAARIQVLGVCSRLLTVTSAAEFTTPEDFRLSLSNSPFILSWQSLLLSTELGLHFPILQLCSLQLALSNILSLQICLPGLSLTL